MNGVSRLVLLCGVLVLLAGGAGAWAETHRAASAPPVARLEGTEIWNPHMRPAPAFSGRDQAGRMITRAGLRGRVWAVTFLDSHCTQTCPVEARDLATVQRALGPNYPLTIVVVSVLPSYDTPARARTFMRTAGVTGNWHWIMGSYSALARIWKAYGIWVLTGQEHTSALYLVDRHGDVRIADGVPFLPDQLAASVRALDGPPRSATSQKS